jgi:hypothetical protein|tara:strand:- start:754 stop:966 length:213 start_codon:yes stop_codon:yes gene_type:complete
MARTKNINGVRTAFTAEEETARDAQETQAAIDQQARIDAQTLADAKLASGKAKLKELGLDDDEVKQIVGI